MSRLIVSSYMDNSVIKYGLFNGNVESDCLYHENFQPVLFDTEEETLAKISTLEENRSASTG